jgi:hypothetical protein
VFGIGRLIVGTSGSPGSLQALRYAEAFARACDAALIPVIAWEPPGGDRSDRIQPSGDLRQACRDLAWQQLRDALLTVWARSLATRGCSRTLPAARRAGSWWTSPAGPAMCSWWGPAAAARWPGWPAPG